MFWYVRASPARAMRVNREPVEHARPEANRARRAGGSRPVIALISEVLPAPFGPMRPTTAPEAMSSDTSIERGDASVAHLDGLDPERVRHFRCHSPAMPRGANRTNASKDRAGRDVAIVVHEPHRLRQDRHDDAPRIAPIELVAPPITQTTRICSIRAKPKSRRRDEEVGVCEEHSRHPGDGRPR